MSTNKTTYYHLHSWASGDDFLREEFNENFEAVDSVLRKKPDIVIGSYMGNNQSTQDIALGFRPRALLIADRYGRFIINNAEYGYGGFFTATSYSSSYTARLTDSGFRVMYLNGADANTQSFSPYSYLAIR